MMAFLRIPHLFFFFFEHGLVGGVLGPQEFLQVVEDDLGGNFCLFGFVCHRLQYKKVRSVKLLFLGEISFFLRK